MSNETYRKAIELNDELVSDGVIRELDDAEMAKQGEGFAICVPVSHYALQSVPEIWKDQIDFADCAECDTPIFFRNNLPPQHVKLCMQCGMQIMLMMRAKHETVDIITNKSGTSELREYIKKGSN